MLLGACKFPDASMEDSVASQVGVASNFTMVKTIKVRFEKFNYSIQTTGKVVPHFNQIVYALTEGRIVKSYAENGKIFQAGNVLVAFDTRSIESKLRKSKEDLFNADINYKSNLLSQESLLKNKSQRIKDTVLRKLRVTSGIPNAEFEYSQLNIELQNAIIKAPFCGRIANVQIQNGMYAKTGQELFSIYSHNDLYIDCQVLESDIGRIFIGQEANVSPLSTNQTYNAQVAEINPMVDNSGMVRIKLKLTTYAGLIPGMNCSINIQIPSNKCLIVPKEAIVMRSGKAVVFTNDNGSAKWNYVLTGLDNGIEIEIKEGLKQGDEVIISNNIQLSQNSVIKTTSLK